jgi:RNA recognition motif-containing protein
MEIEIENFSKKVTKAELKKLFRKFGDVEEVEIWHNPRTGKSTGLGWVHMPFASEAESAIKALNGRRWKGKTVKVHRRPSNYVYGD